MVTLPTAAKKALQGIPKAPLDEKSELAGAALEAVGYPTEGRFPLASELTDTQRAVATALAPMRDVWLGQWRIPQPSWARLRWLGLAPPGVIDRPLKAPLWQKLHAAGKSEAQIKAFKKLDLPLLDRLEAYGDIVLGGYRLFAVWSDFDEIRGPAVGAWAKAFAERAAAAMVSEENDKIVHLMRSAWLVVALGLARSKIPFEGRWASIVNPSDGPPRLVIEALKGIHEPLRSTILAERVTKNVFSGAAVEGLELLAHFPSAALANAILAKADRASKPKATIVAGVTKVAQKHDAVEVALDAFKGKQPRPLPLTLARTTIPKRVSDLKGIRREQVTAMLDAWDDHEERPAEQDLPSMGLRIRELVGSKKQPAYDAVSFNADDGLVFVAGTTEVVAHLVQHGVRCDDQRLYDALHAALCFEETKTKSKTMPRQGRRTQSGRATKAVKRRPR